MGIWTLFIKYAVFITTYLTLVSGARILIISQLPLKSHDMVFHSFATEMNSRGHDIVIVTANPINNSNLKNYRQIVVPDLIDTWRRELNYVHLTEKGIWYLRYMYTVLRASTTLCKQVFDHAEVKILIQNQCQEKFDLVIAGWAQGPCMNAFAHHFGVPMIGFLPMSLTYVNQRSVGNPTHPIYGNEMSHVHLNRPTFWEKVYRSVNYVCQHWYWYSILIPEHDKVVRQYFGDSMPYIGELERNVSLVFTARQSLYYDVVPKVPTIIEMGPIHLQENKPLPKDLKEFLDGSSEGAVYFSLGSNVKATNIPSKKIQMFLDAFSELKELRFLWKWDSDQVPGNFSNIKFRKWFPQQDVLEHKQLKVFIYQGGLHSTEEAIRNEVPMIGMPFQADQMNNVRSMVEAGTGIMLDYTRISKEGILNVLKEILYDPKYKENIRKLSKITEDQPQKPMEKAIWWTEYVIRHRGAQHLRSAIMDVSWFEYLLLDVIAFFSGVCIASLYMLYHITRFIIKIGLLFFKMNNKKSKQQ